MNNFLDNAEKKVWLVGLILGSVYAVGWFIQYVVAFALNVGPIMPPKEACIASGLTFFALLVPLIFNLFKNQILPIRPNKPIYHFSMYIGTIAFFCCFYYAILSLTLQSSARHADPWLLYKSMLFFALFNALYLFSKWKMFKEKNPYLILWCLLALTFYSSLIAPHLQPVCGGYVLTQVEIEMNDTPKAEKWLLITSDSQTVILSKEKDAESFCKNHINNQHSRITRVNWSRIKSLSSVP